MFDWGELKRGVPNSVRFCIGDIPMFIFFIPTHPYLIPTLPGYGDNFGPLLIDHNKKIYNKTVIYK